MDVKIYNDESFKVKKCDIEELISSIEEISPNMKQYDLNGKKALQKIASNARIPDLTCENKTTCTNIQLSSGAYQFVVMNLVRSLKKDDIIENEAMAAKCLKN